MARVLIVQHTADEGLGNFFEWLPAAGLDVHPIHPYQGARIPTVVEGDALLVLGGPMSAYDDEVAPWLPAVRDLLASAVEDGVPTLGICLGAQLLAVATGGEVTSPAAGGPEIGMTEISVTVEDDLFRVGGAPVIQAHNDAVTTLPPGGTVCATNDRYANQAFRIGDVAWGVQFHPEADLAMISRWITDSPADVAATGQTVEEAIAGVEGSIAAIEAFGRGIAERFAALVTG